MVECFSSFGTSSLSRCFPVEQLVLNRRARIFSHSREDIYDDVESYRAGRRAISIARGLLQEERGIPIVQQGEVEQVQRRTTTTTITPSTPTSFLFTPPTPETPTRTTSTFPVGAALRWDESVETGKEKDVSMSANIVTSYTCFNEACEFFFILFFPAERERNKTREPWGETAITEEPGASDCLAAAATTTTTEIVSESPRPAPSAVSSLVEDDFFDFGGILPEEEEEEIISVTTTTTIAPVVEGQTESEQVGLETIVVEEEGEGRTTAVERENVEAAEGEEGEATPSSSSRRRRRTTTTTAATPRSGEPSGWLEDSEEEESGDVLPSLGNLAAEAPEYVREADDFLAISRWVAHLPRSGRSLYERSLRSSVRHEAISGGRIGICQGNGNVEIGPLGRTSSGEDRVWNIDELRILREEQTTGAARG